MPFFVYSFESVFADFDETERTQSEVAVDLQGRQVQPLDLMRQYVTPLKT